MTFDDACAPSSGLVSISLVPSHSPRGRGESLGALAKFLNPVTVLFRLLATCRSGHVTKLTNQLA